MNVVVAYDIRDDDRRARVAAMLASHGNRIQKSVFDCVVSPEELATLVESLGNLINHETDVLHMLRQCSDCRAGRVEFGQVDNSLHEWFWVL